MKHRVELCPDDIGHNSSKENPLSIANANLIHTVIFYTNLSK